MSNYTRKPVILNEANHELLKSQPGWAGQRHGDHWKEREAHGHDAAGIHQHVRVPGDRLSGNDLFRRYPNGDLDINYAAHKVIDALHRVKDSGGIDVCNTLEKVALSVLFPGSFDYVDSAMVESVARVQLRLAPHEMQQIRMRVAAHLAEEMNWNAGFGGGSVPGRSTTKE